MTKRGKRYDANAAKIEDKTYKVEEAIALIKTLGSAKFDESVETHLKLGIDTKQGDQQVRGTVVLPHGIGKTKRIAVFADGENEIKAKEAGADLVGGKELIDKIAQTGKVEFDVAVATPDMMKELAKIAKILGPKGLMPSPKNETVTTNIAKAVQEMKAGKIAFKNDSNGIVHQAIGKVSFSPEQLAENYRAFADAVKRAKPAASKGTYLQTTTLTTTMGPGISIAE
jgi:large subunit ribosomal protein L1